MPTQINEGEEKVILKLRELPEGKKTEVLDFIDFLIASGRVPRADKEGEEYAHYLATLRHKIRERGGSGLGKSKD